MMKISRFFPLCAAAALLTGAVGAAESAPHFVLFTDDPPVAVSLTETAPNIFENPGRTLRVSLVKDRLGELDQWIISLENTGSSEWRLEPGLCHSGLDRKDFPVYWDGSATESVVADLTLPHLRDNIRRLAPWASLFGGNEGLLLGLNPGELRSYLATKLSEDQSDLQFQVTTRLVLAPGQKDVVRFFSARYPVAYGGQREAVQRIQDAFPADFSRNPSTSDCVDGASAQYWMARVSPEKIPGQAPLEFLRRFSATWDWVYAPFKRTGDHWGHEKWWDYTPFTSFQKVRASILQQSFSFDEMNRDDFLKIREQFFNRWRGFYGNFFYSPAGAWIEKQLAEKEFPDAIIDDPDYRCVLDSWVTGWDREVTVLPWFTSYEKTLREDFRRIAETYNIGGIALDVARGGPRYRGPVIAQPIPARAYDAKGVFIDQGVGVAKFIEYLHTLPVRGTGDNLAVVGNPETGGQTFTVTTRYDAGMFEGPPYHPGSNTVPLARYLLGRKTLSWWKGWAYTTYAAPNWSSQSREEFIKTMQGLADYTIFSSFEYAALPTIPYQFGVPKLTRHIPEMIASNARGWQAVFPVRQEFAGDILHTARYGRGLRTRLFFGNPHDEAFALAATVESGRIGDRAYVFADYLNGPGEIANVFDSPDSRFSFSMPSRQPVLLDAAAALPPGFRGTVTASWRHSFYTHDITLRFDPAPQEPLEIGLPVIPGFRLEKAAGGTEVLPVAAGGEGYVSTIPPSTGEVRVFYTSEYLGLSREDVFAFPFFDPEGNPAFDVTSEQVGLLEQSGLGERIAQYFQFYARVALGNVGPKPLVFAAASNRPAWAIRIDAAVDAPSIRGDGANRLLLAARDTTEAGRILEVFFRALDERYPVHPGFISTWGMDGKMLKHFGMTGKNLPEN